MTMHDLNLLSNDDVSEDGKEGKYSRESGLSIYYEKRHMIHFKTVS